METQKLKSFACLHVQILFMHSQVPVLLGQLHCFAVRKGLPYYRVYTVSHLFRSVEVSKWIALNVKCLASRENYKNSS